jgi:NAD(P)-dependent dehydrogenase (short-subunit alcohol dehydrogenase family)
MGKLDGKVAIITGASSGIGKGIARGLATEGARTIITARGVERLDSAAQEIRTMGGTVIAVPTDVSDDVQVSRLFDRAMDLFHRVDLLVNNAGQFDGGPLDELSVETWDKVIATNLRGPFLCTRSAMRIMKKQGGGRIINIGSISAQRPRVNSGPYSTSKFGLWGLTIVTALEGREHRISACCLHPGNVRVERVRDQLEPPGEPTMKVEELAEVALLMACLPPGIDMLEAIVLPVGQPYLGRG